ncbi:MAG: amino acid ABC transporter permease [Acidimicrobiia bacterium]
MRSKPLPADPKSPGLLPSWRGAARKEGARAVLISTVSTIVFAGVVVWAVLSSETWPRVREQFFSLRHFELVWPAVLRGFWLDVRMFLGAETLILFAALIVAAVRSLRGPIFFPVRALSVLYVDLVRGIPLLLMILVLGFGVPALDLPGVPRSALFWGVTALVLSYTAYTAEIYRAGIESVHESQRMSAQSLGLSQLQTLRHVLVPQAVRNVIPALLSSFVSLQKDVALVFVLGVREGVREAQIYNARTFNYTGYIAATILFLLVSVPVARFTDWYGNRVRRRRQAMSQ